jgi:hypothetical protein
MNETDHSSQGSRMIRHQEAWRSTRKGVSKATPLPHVRRPPRSRQSEYVKLRRQDASSYGYLFRLLTSALAKRSHIYMSCTRKPTQGHHDGKRTKCHSCPRVIRPASCDPVSSEIWGYMKSLIGTFSPYTPWCSGRGCGVQAAKLTR